MDKKKTVVLVATLVLFGMLLFLCRSFDGRNVVIDAAGTQKNPTEATGDSLPTGTEASTGTSETEQDAVPAETESAEETEPEESSEEAIETTAPPETAPPETQPTETAPPATNPPSTQPPATEPAPTEPAPSESQPDPDAEDWGLGEF